jgi:CheY-like chemotaxis protein
MNEQVMVVQPDSEQGKRIQRILLDLGVLSLCLDRGEKALKMFEAMGLPRLIVLEPVLSDMDGFELLEKLRDAACKDCAPVVILTSHPDTLNRAQERGGQLGILAVLSSRCPALVLQQQLRDALYRSQSCPIHLTKPVFPKPMAKGLAA